MEKLFFNYVTQQIGGYKFQNHLLLEQAFTRKSYTAENGGENNEVLEFIGDKVLDVAVVRYLTEKYGNDLHVQEKIPLAFRVKTEPEEFVSKLSEGDLTKFKQRMVEKKALASRIDELGLAQFLRMGKGDEQKNVDQQPSVKEDLFEAIIGAVALDCNWNFDILQSVVEVMLCPDSFIEDEKADYVGLIYEWSARRTKSVPLFKYFDEGVNRFIYNADPEVIYVLPQGRWETNHAKYACRLKLADDLPFFEGYGESKNKARKSVCERAYKYLKEHGLLVSIKDEISNPNAEDAIGQLEILARRGYFDIPIYNTEESHDEDGNPIWNVRCHIEQIDRSFASINSSKKVAKKKAAYKMLQYVLEPNNFESKSETQR